MSAASGSIHMPILSSESTSCGSEQTDSESISSITISDTPTINGMKDEIGGNHACNDHSDHCSDEKLDNLEIPSDMTFNRAHSSNTSSMMSSPYRTRSEPIMSITSTPGDPPGDTIHSNARSNHHLNPYSIPDSRPDSIITSPSVNQEDPKRFHFSESLSAPPDIATSRSASQPPITSSHHRSPPTRKSAPLENAFSISTFLRNEIEFIDVARSPRKGSPPKRAVSLAPRKTMTSKSPLYTTVEQTAEQRIFNFFWLFFKLEKLVFFGFWICCDSFLMMITILPTRVLCRLYMKISYILRREWFLITEMLLYYFWCTLFSLKYMLFPRREREVSGLQRDVRSRSLDSLDLNSLDSAHSESERVPLIEGNENNDNEAINDEMSKFEDMMAEYGRYGDCLGDGILQSICRVLHCCIRLNFDYFRHRNLRRIDVDPSDPEWLFDLKCSVIRQRLQFGDRYGSGYEYSARDRLDIVRVFTLLLCVYILTLFNLSQIYHFIRAQENFKLYVLFKIIVIIQHLASSFGEDSTEALFNALDPDKVSMGRVTVNLLVYICYNVLHSLLLYGHLITLNAAMNSPNNTLITILVADNFYELKSTVFKKYALENLFQMLCSDIVERFTIFLFVLLILMQNLCYLGWDSFNAEEWVFEALQLFGIMVGMEMIVDTAKHGFICKFNNFSVAVYNSFYLRLSMDVTNARRMSYDIRPDSDGVSEDSTAKNLGQYLSNGVKSEGSEDVEEKLLFFMDRRLGTTVLEIGVFEHFQTVHHFEYFPK